MSVEAQGWPQTQALGHQLPGKAWVHQAEVEEPGVAGGAVCWDPASPLLLLGSAVGSAMGSGRNSGAKGGVEEF